METTIKTIITCVLCLVAVGLTAYLCRDVYIDSVKKNEEVIYVEQKTKRLDSTFVNEMCYLRANSKYLYLKSGHSGAEQNFRFTFGASGIPSNAVKFVIETKGENTAGLTMAFRNHVDASYTDNITSERMPLNGTKEWVRNEVAITNDYLIYHSMLIYVPAKGEISIDNIGFILNDGSFRSVQDFESLTIGDSHVGNLDSPANADILSKFGTSGTTGWNFNGIFEVRGEEVPVPVTEPTAES